MRYVDTIPLSNDGLSVATAAEVLQYLRGFGTAEVSHDLTSLTFEIDLAILSDVDPDDAWTLRDMLAEIEHELSIRGFEWHADREKVQA